MHDGTKEATEPEVTEREVAESVRLRQLAEFRYHLRQFLSFSEREAERFGIAAQQYQLLQVIGAMGSGSAASISVLAERMVLRHNSTVELVDRAEKAGLVRRVTDERDLRRSIVEMTSHGEAVLRQMIDAHWEQLRGAAGENLLQTLHDIRERGTEDPGEETVPEGAERAERSV